MAATLWSQVTAHLETAGQQAKQWVNGEAQSLSIINLNVFY